MKATVPPVVALTAEPASHADDEPSEGEAEILALETKLRAIREARRLREVSGHSLARRLAHSFSSEINVTSTGC